MNAALSSVLWGLGRTSLLLAIVGLAAALVLRLARVRSPRVHRLACLATLLVGWTFVQVPLEVPWYAAPAPASAPPKLYVVQTPPVIDVAPPQQSPFILPHYQREPEETLAPPIVITRPLPMVKQQASHHSASSQPASAPLVWRFAPGVLLAGWAAGIVAIVLWWIVAYVRFVWRLPAGLPGEQAWLDEWRALQSGERVRRLIPLRVTADVGPLVCRLPRGTELLVPLAVWQELSTSERRAVLAHELAHHQRGDLWRSLAMRVLALPHWFNPVAWLAVRRFDEAAEWACDRAATGECATDYAKMLLRLSEVASRSAPFSSAMSNVPLTSRIKRIITRNAADSLLKRALVIALLLVALPLAAVQIRLVAQEAAPAEKEAEKKPAEVQPPATTVTREAPPATPPVANTEDVPQVERPTAVRAAQQNMIDAAKRAYEATDASVLNGTATLDGVVAWSTRWLQAELTSATSKAERLKAAQEHLTRMKSHQARVRQLAENNNPHGRAEFVAATDYFVADAERRLAEIEADEDSVSLIRPPRAGAVPSTALLHPGMPSAVEPKPFTLGGKLYAADDPELPIVLHKALSDHVLASRDDTQMVEALNILAIREMRVEQESGKLLMPEPVLIDDLIELLDYHDEAILTAAFRRLERLSSHIKDPLKKAAGSSRRDIAKRARYLLDVAPSVPVPAGPKTEPRIELLGVGESTTLRRMLGAGVKSDAGLIVTAGADAPAAQVSVQLNGKSYPLSDPELVPAIEAALQSDKESEQMTALIATGMLDFTQPRGSGPKRGPAEASVPADLANDVMQHFDNPNRTVRDFAAQILLSKRDSIEPELESAAKSSNRWIAERAQTLLKQTQPHPINVTPEFLLNAGPEFLRADRAFVDRIPQVTLRGRIFLLDDPDLTTTLHEVLSNRDDRELLAALSIAGFSSQTNNGPRIGPQTEVADAMIALLDHPEVLIRDWAANVLLVMRGEIEPKLQQAASSSNPTIAEQAKSVLARELPAQAGQLLGTGVNSNAGVIGTLVPDTPTVGPPADSPALSAQANSAPAPQLSSAPPGQAFAAAVNPNALRYDGKSFDDWASQLRTELSQARRTEALYALEEFAANGYGAPAIRVIFEAIRNESTYSLFEGSPAGKLRTAAFKAALHVPADIRLPAIRTALETGNANQRMFAVRIMPVDDSKDEVLPLLLPILNDSNRELVQVAQSVVAAINHDQPELVESLKQSLASDKLREILQALLFVSGNSMHMSQNPQRIPPYPQLIPEVVALIDSSEPNVSENARLAILRTGQPALDPLETIMAGGGPQADTARRLWDKIEAAPAVNRPQ